MDAPIPPTTIKTSVPDAERRITALRDALEHRKGKVLTPYKPNSWEQLLLQYSLLAKYPKLPSSICHGFDVGIRQIHCTFSPPNSHSTLLLVEAYQWEVAKNLSVEGILVLSPVRKSRSSLDLSSHPHFLLSQNQASLENSGQYIISLTLIIPIMSSPPLTTPLTPVFIHAHRELLQLFATPFSISLLHLRHWSMMWPKLIVPSPFMWTNGPVWWSGLNRKIYSQSIPTTTLAYCQLRAFTVGLVTLWLTFSEHMELACYQNGQMIIYSSACHVNTSTHIHNSRRQIWHATITQNGGQVQSGSQLWYQGEALPNGLPAEFHQDASANLLDWGPSLLGTITSAYFSHAFYRRNWHWIY